MKRFDVKSGERGGQEIAPPRTICWPWRRSFTY